MNFKILLNGLILGVLLIMGGNLMCKAKNIDNTAGWDKTFTKSQKVEVEKVSFKNRYGITLAGDLYKPKNKNQDKLPAIAVSGPFGAVK